MVYIPECKQQLRATKSYAQMRDIAYFKSGLYFYYSQRAVDIAWLHVTNHLYQFTLRVRMFNRLTWKTMI